MERNGPQRLSLYGRDGRRKYLTSGERAAFIAAAHLQPRKAVRDLCLMLAYSGCRLSEGLALTEEMLNPTDGYVAIRCLKKRGRVVIREVPMPTSMLEMIHKSSAGPQARLWPWSRGRAWVLIKRVMLDAGIAEGPHRTPKGLRHAYGIHAIRSGVPLNLVQRWLGHASLATTAIYTDAIGAEEREIASRMWL